MSQLNLMTLVGNCSLCGERWTLDIQYAPPKPLTDDEAIYRRFPSLSPEERDLLKTGYCVECFDIAMENQ